jgi:acyl carrier protein
VNQDDVFSVVLRTAANVLSVDMKRLSADSSPVEVESWDSVRHLNLILALEAKYAIAFEPEEMDQLRTLGEIAAVIHRRISN